MPGISDLLDSDMEENNYMDENSIISSATDATDAPSNSDNRLTAKKGKKRHRVTMPKTKSRITKPSPAPPTKRATKKTAAARRKDLENATDEGIVAENQQAVDLEEDDLMDTEDADTIERKPASKKTVKSVRTARELEEGNILEVEQTPLVARSSHASKTQAKAVPKVAKTNKPLTKAVAKQAVPETHTEHVLVDGVVEEVDDLLVQQPLPKRARTESRTRQESGYRRRAGSASDTERGDPNLRRKLGDVTRKFENIDMKYKNLKEVGIGEASANAEKLRRQCEAITEASNSLVSSLKKELGLQAPLVQDARILKKELQLKEEELVKSRSIQAELSASLAAATNEVRILQAKLAAARTAATSAEPQPTKVPGSAMKHSRSMGTMGSDAAQAAQISQMKLDLYGDLTGLIVRSVKRSEDGDTFDCIQTGRNGTLHFKLFIDQEDAKTAGFEETEFLYTPFLDANRDHDMIEIMPQYLTEDITFARQNAAKFYQRVVDTLTRRGIPE